jgi:hypothetical protein
MSLTFRIYRGEQLLREETLAQPVIKIGKVVSAHLRLEDESISRMHAIIEVARDSISVIDLGSTRGTFVNGQRINKATIIPGDSITVGDMRVELVKTQPTLVVAPPPVPVPPVVAVVAAPPPPPAPKPMLPPAEDVVGARAIEVAAMLGDSVVDVKHCIDPKSGTVTRRTKALFAAGVACVLASGAAFASSVHTAANNKAAFDYWTRVEHRPAGAFRAEMPGQGYDWVAFGGFAFGILALARGLARMRDEKKSPYYRIGTAPGVELPIEQAPAPDFPLVAPRGEDFVFNYGAGMDGELMLDGKSTSFAELIASGQARPSMTTAGALELPIPARAKIRARAGQTTFVVSAVTRPRRQAPAFLANLENRTLAYFAGSLAVHIGVWALLNTIPEDSGAANVDFPTTEPVAVNITGTDHEDKVDPPDPETGDGGQDSGSMKLVGEEGQAGTEKSTNTGPSKLEIEKKTENPQVARAEAIEMARNYGIIGDLPAAVQGFNVDVDGITSGFDGQTVYGAVDGTGGEGYGHFGMGRSGFGGGGGCAIPPCGTIPGTGYGTIGNGRHAGSDYGVGNGHGPGLGRHVVAIPEPVISDAHGGGDLDKAIIRRYIKRQSDKLSYCYEKQLLAHPGEEGTISIQFLIMPNGSVTSPAAKGFDSEVASCVAGVIGAIEFPSPKGGGAVQVNYPLTFHAAGQ